MCVIAYKPKNIAFPSETILKNCYENNPDGAGFMYAYKGEVYIQKGYDTWEKFIKALNDARRKTNDNIPYVMHFRIATQGFEKCMTHPFPLSQNMNDLKQLKIKSKIGIAHNGVLQLTSDGSKTYSDTMKFITDYLSLIINNKDYYKDSNKKLLIERLIDGSRLAILDNNEHCELLGKGWVEDNNIFYSNTSYSYKKQKFIFNSKWANCYDFWIDDYDKYFNEKSGMYDFNEMNCPFMLDGDDGYCDMCSHCNKCNFCKALYEDDYLLEM